MEVDEWTDEEDKELIDSYVNERLSILDIAEIHSRTQADIAIRLVKLGIVFNRNECNNPPLTISNKSCKKCLELTQENESLKLQLSEAMKLADNMRKFKHLKHDIVKIKPSSLDDLKQISGIGDVKLARYGEDILTILRNHSI